MKIILIFYLITFVMMDATGNILPIIRIGRFRNEEIEGKLNMSKGLTFNNGKYNTSSRWKAILHDEKKENDSKTGFVHKKEQIVVGYGEEDFHKATRLLRSFEHVQQLNWVRLAYQRIPPRKGDCVATISKFYSTPIWSFNPCQITSSEANRPYSMGLDNLITRNSKSYREGVDVCVPDMTHRTSGRYSEVVFSTLHGHMIAGVEAMRVYTVPCYLEHLFPCGGGERKGREPGNADIVSAVSVVYEIESLSRGSGLLGNICMPLLRPLQSKFMRDSCSSFLALMQNSSKI